MFALYPKTLKGNKTETITHKPMSDISKYPIPSSVAREFGWIHSYRWITQVQNTGNRAEDNTQFLVNLWMETYKQERGGDEVATLP